MKKTNNKGFSLVELIIVIAIMAILVGAIAPALIRYIDKSRKSNDVSACKTIKTAVETAMANEDAYEKLTAGDPTVLTITPNTKLTTASGGATNTSAISGITDTDTLSEIAKNIGDKTPKISYKKAARSGVNPEKFYVVIAKTGSIYVGIGSTAPTAAPTVGTDGKYSATGWYLICPDVCTEYK